MKFFTESNWSIDLSKNVYCRAYWLELASPSHINQFWWKACPHLNRHDCRCQCQRCNLARSFFFFREMVEPHKSLVIKVTSFLQYGAATTNDWGRLCSFVTGLQKPEIRFSEVSPWKLPEALAYCGKVLLSELSFRPEFTFLFELPGCHQRSDNLWLTAESSIRSAEPFKTRPSNLRGSHMNACCVWPRKCYHGNHRPRCTMFFLCWSRAFFSHFCARRASCSRRKSSCWACLLCGHAYAP